MASLSVRRLDEETMCRLRMRAARQNVSVEEAVRRILRVAVADEEPVGTMIRRLIADLAYGYTPRVPRYSSCNAEGADGRSE